MGGRMGPMKRCPECAEDVRADAFRCRHCQVEFGSPDDGEVINGWIRSHPTIAASLATFLYVAFQIFKAGDFEVNTTVELLRAGGLTSILLGVLLVQLPIELVLLNLAVCWWLLSMPAGRGRTSAGRPTGSHRPALAAIGGLLVLSFYVTPWPFFTLSAVLSAAAVHVSTRWLGHARVVRSARVAMAILVATSILVLVQRPTIWVPAENVTLGPDGTVVAYVISDDGRWTTLLTPQWTGHLRPGANSIVRVPTDRITAREPCAIDFLESRLFSRVLRLRPVQLVRAFSERRLPRPLTPPCR